MGVDQNSTAKQRMPTSGNKAFSPPVNSSASIAAVVAGDASLLMVASGVCILTMSGLLSLSMLALDENLTSVTQFRLFSTSMVTGSVLLTVGVLNGMLNYSNRKAKAESGEVVFPPGHPPISPKKLAEMVELDGNGIPKKRVSRCPMGF